MRVTLEMSDEVYATVRPYINRMVAKWDILVAIDTEPPQPADELDTAKESRDEK